MTGVELRKKSKSISKKVHTKKQEISKTASPSASSDAAVRFKLGNGVVSLTSKTLIGLVESTCPYLYPRLFREIIDETDEDFYELLPEGIASSSSASSSDMQSALLSVGDDSSDGDAAHQSLISQCESSIGWREIVQTPLSRLPAAADKPTKESRIEYFALCIAAHFTTVATFVPTDVDSKIRGHCWADPDVDVMKAQFQAVKKAMSNWSVAAVSQRAIDTEGVLLGTGYISGHDGEWVGVLAGAMCAFTRLREEALAQEAEDLITNELSREANVFQTLVERARQARGDRLDTASLTLLVKLAAVMTHNVIHSVSIYIILSYKLDFLR